MDECVVCFFNENVSCPASEVVLLWNTIFPPPTFLFKYTHTHSEAHTHTPNKKFSRERFFTYYSRNVQFCFFCQYVMYVYKFIMSYTFINLIVTGFLLLCMLNDLLTVFHDCLNFALFPPAPD